MIKEKNMYKPLPDSLTIKTSKVNGLGLFAKEGIAQGTNLGTTHIKIENDEKENEIIRLPLGGFINHANDANCVKVELHDNRYKKIWTLVTLRNIKEGEELTLRYTFYNI
jgi:SET domain-containing protein